MSICLSRKWLSMDGVHSGAAGLWVRGAGLGAAAAAAVHRVGLPAPKGAYCKAHRMLTQGTVPCCTQSTAAEMPHIHFQPFQTAAFLIKVHLCFLRGQCLRGSVCPQSQIAPAEDASVLKIPPGLSQLPARPRIQYCPPRPCTSLHKRNSSQINPERATGRSGKL